MINAWSLAGSILSGTLDEEYPIKQRSMEELDPYEYYDTSFKASDVHPITCLRNPWLPKSRAQISEGLIRNKKW